MTSLFDHLPTEIKVLKSGYLFSDGGSRGNPGSSGAGFVIYDAAKKEVFSGQKFLGHQTNNYAEYQGVILGLQLAIDQGFSDLEVRLDSKLIVEQMSGNWKVKNANIKPLFEQAKAREEKFRSVNFKHIPREKNKRADQLANQAMDGKK
jgi:probable phosphoglycerate mutase